MLIVIFFSVLLDNCKFPSRIYWYIKELWNKQFSGKWVVNLTISMQTFLLNAFSPSQLLTPNFSLHNTYKIRHLVVRKWELIKQSKLLKIKIKILSSLFNEKYGLKLGELQNTTGTERVKRIAYSQYSFAGSCA